MNNSDNKKLLGAWAYVGLGLLYAIPIIGLVFLIIFTFNKNNLNRRSFTRSYWCWLLITIVIFGGIFAVLQAKGENIINTIYSLAETIDSFNPLYHSNNIPVYGSTQNSPAGVNPTVQVPIIEVPVTSEEKNATIAGIPIEQIPVIGTSDAPSSQVVTNGNVPVQNADNGVSKELKEFLDSYEAFVDEYVAFMSEYDKNSLSPAMMTSYLNLMNKSIEMEQKVAEIDESTLSIADSAYYTEVTLRCSQKMLTVAGKLS